MPESSPLVVITSGCQPLLARSVAGERSPRWIASPDEAVARDLKTGWLPTEPGDGFAAAANRALRRARRRGHDVIVLLNDDAALAPGARELLVAAVSRPGVAAVGAMLMEEDGRTVQSCGLRVGLGGGRVTALRPTRGSRSFPVQALPATALALSVGPALEVGGFDAARYPFYFEDVDLCLRLRRQGYQVLLVPEARAIHRGAATAGRGSRFAVYHQARGQVTLALGPQGGGPVSAIVAALSSAAALLRPGDAPRAARAAAMLLGLRDGFGRRPALPPDPPGGGQ